jgi:hypothetical protein
MLFEKISAIKIAAMAFAFLPDEAFARVVACAFSINS